MKKFKNEAYLKSWKDHHKEEGGTFFDISTRGTTHIEGVGGSVWPPRSYTCSFCKREFKSAQALGGHMNVHRRDRALLKQVINNNNNNPNNNNNNNKNNNCNYHHNNNNNKTHDYYYSSKSMVDHHQNKKSHINNVPRKSFLQHLSSSNISSKYLQSSHNYHHVSGRRFGDHVKEENFRGKRSSSDEYLMMSYKRCKKSNGGYVALLPSFYDDEQIKHLNVKDDVVLHVTKMSKCVDDDELDLELRLGNLNQKIK